MMKETCQFQRKRNPSKGVLYTPETAAQLQIRKLLQRDPETTPEPPPSSTEYNHKKSPKVVSRPDVVHFISILRRGIGIRVVVGLSVPDRQGIKEKSVVLVHPVGGTVESQAICTTRPKYSDPLVGLGRTLSP